MDCFQPSKKLHPYHTHPLSSFYMCVLSLSLILFSLCSQDAAVEGREGDVVAGRGRGGREWRSSWPPRPWPPLACSSCDMSSLMPPPLALSAARCPMTLRGSGARPLAPRRPGRLGRTSSTTSSTAMTPRCHRQWNAADFANFLSFVANFPDFLI